MSVTGGRTDLGLIRTVVIFLAVATAFIHLYLLIIEGPLASTLGYTRMLPIYQLLFVGNILAYTTLTIALYFIPPLARFRPIIRTLLIAIATAAIISYFHVNVRDSLGDLTKVIEVLLIALLTVDTVVSSRSSRE